MYKTLAAYTFAALYIFLPSVPVTHALGLLAHLPRSAKLKHLLLYPLHGGREHFIFQVVSWAVWAGSVLIALPVATSHPWKAIPLAHVEALSGAAAFGTVFAELFMIKSLLVFDPKAPKLRSDDQQSDSQPSSPMWNRSRLPSKSHASAAVVVIGILWMVMGGGLLLATEYLEEQATRLTYYIFAFCCLVVGATTTHGLGGKLRHPAPPEDGMIARSGYRFWQPFRGGVAFIMTQAAGWAMFSLAAAFMIWAVIQLAQGMAYCVQCWALMTGATMFAAQLLLGVSVLTYKGAPGKVLEAAANPVRTAAPLLALWLPMLATFTPIHSFITLVVLTFFLVPPNYAAAFWVGSLTVYYLLTGFGAPEHTGTREWAFVVGLYQRYMLASLQWWFGNVEVVKHGKTGFSPHQRYLLGYSPHGLFPIGAAYLPFLPPFRAIAGAMRSVTVVASAIFYPPVIRDICSWCGLRVVARRTIIRALEDKGAVILVPGGQAELVLTWRMFRRNSRGNREYVVYTRHKGFIKLAIEQQAHLVPVLVLGEVCSLRNFIDIPALQQWTYKKIGFPVPYLVVGWGGCTPLPKTGRGLRFIIGEPIRPPILEPGQQVEQSAIDELHKAYYSQVSEIWAANQPTFPGYEDVELVLCPS